MAASPNQATARRTNVTVFVTGATGYLGRTLVPRLVERGHAVRALVRDAELARAVAFPGARVAPPSSERASAPLAGVVELVEGDALHAASFARHVHGCEVLVQLVGTPKPAPWKGASFRAVDRASALASLDAALEAGVAHYVYLSVAQPAPVMRAYVAVRAECEGRIAASGLAATFVRPWYVLGPGHRWPLVLAPVYAVLERVPATRASAVRLGLVRLEQVVHALVAAVEHPPRGVRVVETAELRAGRA